MFRKCLFYAACLAPLSIQSATKLRIQGSTTVNPVVAEAAEHFRKKGWTLLVDTQGGSSGGISALGEGLADIAMASKPITEKDRKRFPKVDFQQHAIGYDGVALVVSKAVYESGVKSLSKEEIKNIYESKIKNWKQLGGADKRIVFFNKEPGRGTWEVFAKFLYGKTQKAPKVFHPEVGANEEARSKVASHPSAITQLSATWAYGHDKVKAVSIRTNKTTVVDPTLANIKNQSYPLRRPLLLITNGQPKSHSQQLIDYLKSEPGQKLVKKFGYLPIH